MNLVQHVLAFNRFYTKRIGVLDPRFLKSPFSLTEVRILFELAHGKDVTAKDLVRELGLDPGYMSRTLRGLERRGLVRRERSSVDGRKRLVFLTAAGRRTFGTLDRRQSREVKNMLARLTVTERRRLLRAMATVQELVGRVS